MAGAAGCSGEKNISSTLIDREKRSNVSRSLKIVEIYLQGSTWLVQRDALVTSLHTDKGKKRAKRLKITQNS
jgi:hypothetical protein